VYVRLARQCIYGDSYRDFIKYRSCMAYTYGSGQPYVYKVYVIGDF